MVWRNCPIKYENKFCFKGKEERKMETTVYNPQKGRLETIDVNITKSNTTWFEDCVQDYDVYSITDIKGGLVIRELGEAYPFWIYDITRSDIGHDKQRAKEIHRMYEQDR
jgi:hypothetical protein